MAAEHKLVIEFDRDTLTDGYYLGLTINKGETTPDTLEKCILVQTYINSIPEKLIRIATLTDLETYGDPPTEFIFLYSSELGADPSVEIGQEIEIFDGNYPGIWVKLGLAGPSFTATITGKYTYGVTIDTPLPSSATSVKMWIDAIATEFTVDVGRFVPTFGSYYLIDEGHFMYDSLSAAVDKLSTLRAQAQSLVDNSELRADSFEGTSEEIFE